MSNRYNPRKLKRDWTARLAAGEKPRDPRQAAIDDQAAFERRQAIRALAGTPRADLLCIHNTPWLDCRICSKPRSAP